jgi:cytochrome c oxidase subunit IV
MADTTDTTSLTGDHAADIDRHVRIYITVFVALMALTIITVAISRVHLPVPIAVTVALVVALIKGSLVACYFMHLISEKKVIYGVLALTVAFFIALLALPVLTVQDGYGIHEPPSEVHGAPATSPHQ